MKQKMEKEGFRQILSTVRWSFGLAWKYERWLLIENIMCNVVLAVFVYLQLSSFSKIVTGVVNAQQLGLSVITPALSIQMLVLIGSFLIPSIFKAIESRNENILRPRMITHLHAAHMEHLAKLDIATIEGAAFQKNLAFANEWGLGSILNVIFNSIEVFKNIVSMITALIILFFIKPILVPLAVIGAIPTYFTEEKYGRKLFRIYTEQTDDNRIISDRKSFFFDAKKMVEILTFNIANIFRTQYLTVKGQWDKKIGSISSKRAVASFLTDLIALGALFVAMGIIVHEGILGTLAVGSLVLTFTSYRNFGGNTNLFFYSITRVQEQVRFAMRWFDLYKIESLIISSPNALHPAWINPPTIEFKDVEFTYPGTERVILSGINLTIDSGQKLALVGLNGAGKTTLIKLLARVYDPSKGSILIDGVDLREIDIDWWRSNLGILFQNFSNFQMTVRDAIGIARAEKPIDEAKMEKAAEESGSMDFIKEFPKKYDQIIWKGFQDGVELSQGQHQRMAVARILYRDALISVLDEPTSSIDAVAEEKIFGILETKMKGKTVVLISHRFSTVKNADKIAVVEDGGIKELGSHKELMKKDGRYAELYNMQANRYLEEK